MGGQCFPCECLPFFGNSYYFWHDIQDNMSRSYDIGDKEVRRVHPTYIHQ